MGRVARVKPNLKLVNLVLLLMLNYSNAAVSLPESVANPDPDFLAMILAITGIAVGDQLWGRLADRPAAGRRPRGSNRVDVRLGDE